MEKITDFIVVGSGIAGLNAARVLAEYGKVLIVTKGFLSDSSTQYAQGGIAAVVNDNDSVASHVQDTLIAGNYHNNKEAVSFLVKQGQQVIASLVNLGVPFDKKKDGSFSTSFEAAHAYPRIFHATDFTGREIEKALIHAVVANKNIEIWEHAFAVDLLMVDTQCVGVEILHNEKQYAVFSRATVLATGGIGQLYQWTTNPSIATGDGIAMASRVGAELADLEFIQFHPTALQDEGQKHTSLFLLSEALRGEGGVLCDSNGERFMQAFHPQQELAPRDIVARAIFIKQQEGTVYLDIRGKGKEFLIHRFPNIYEALQNQGFDLATDLIPITPAAHFLCGGIVTDVYGRTSLKQLFAYGEVTATGVHGANRLASNSLLEGFVFSNQIVACLKELPEKAQQFSMKKKIYKQQSQNTAITKHIKKIMWQDVGIVRSGKKIASAIQKLTELQQEVCDDLETKNMLQVALLIAEAAYRRKESLGTHYRHEEQG